jgi:chaperonin GroES
MIANRREVMAVKPLGDRIVVRPLDPQEKTKSGLVVPDAAKEKPQEGKVIAVGTGRLLEDGEVKRLEVKTGDRVLYGKYAGSEVSLAGEDYLILREEDILAIVQS